MSYADIVFATVPAAPPTWKKRRATSCPAPISANVPYFFVSRLIWNALRFVPTSISAFMRRKMRDDAAISTRFRLERVIDFDPERLFGNLLRNLEPEAF